MTPTFWPSLSLLLALPFYWLAAGLTAIPARDIPAPAIVQNSASMVRGTEISLNGRKFPVNWVQWQEGSSLRIGMSDTGAMQSLGLELLGTDSPVRQPVRWFSGDGEIPLKARFLNPYRYLDLTDILQMAGVQVEARGNTLNLDFPPSQIANVRAGNQSWGKRIVVDLNGPAAWQVSQAKGEGVVMVAAGTNPNLQAAFTASPVGQNLTTDEDDLGSGPATDPNSQLFYLENGENMTKIRINLPLSHGLQVFSLRNPYRLVIDVRPDPLGDRRIAWAEGLTWHQQLVRLGQSVFPVHWLEVDLRSPKIALKPIPSNPNSSQGIAPLVTIARAAQAAAAINGGFFNRNNQLPLGAIRQDSRWLSGPILNRGAIAWQDGGAVKIGRLSLREILTTSTGGRFPISLLNSGYLEKGLARYTPDWGPAYRTLSDGETLIAVQGGRVITQVRGGKAGSDSLPIPSKGYVLVIRKDTVPASALGLGPTLSLESSLIPADFANYPQILAAGPLLLQNRQVVLNAPGEGFSKAFGEQTASRSAVGTTDRGTLIVAAAHNRVGGKGATLSEMAQILQQLGAVDGLNLDGGSSTSLSLGGQLIDRSPVTAARVHNGLGIFLLP